MLDIKLKLRAGHTNERSWMEPSPLKTLFWNVTYACNFRCSICFTDAGTQQDDELSSSEAMDVIGKIHEAGIRDVIISGGEPFVRPDITDMLVEMGRRGIKTRIASNGSLVTDDLLSRLRNESLTESFQISIDSLDPGLYSKIHGVPPDYLENALHALHLIKKHGFHTTVSVRLTPETLPGIPALLDRAVQEGWATVTIHCPVHTRRVADAYSQDADVITILKPVLDYFCSLLDTWLIETYIPWVQFHPVMRRIEKKLKVVHRGCRAGRDRLTIHPSGWLSPCVCMDIPAAYVGNIRLDDLVAAFEHSPICHVMRHPEEYDLCNDCPNLTVCGAGCRATALAISGMITGLDLSCPIRKKRAEREAQKHVSSRD